MSVPPATASGMADCCSKCCCKNDSEDRDKDLTTPVANVVLTPFSVIASACLQVTLTANAADDKALAFNLVCASVIATAGMLMAVYLVIAQSSSSLPKLLSPRSEAVRPEKREGRVLTKVKQLLQVSPTEMSAEERLRVARMMLRCLWFSLSFMTTGLLCRVLNQQLKVRDEVSGSLAVLVWFIFAWSSIGAPLPRFNVWLRKTGSVLTTMFPLVLLVVYGVLFFTGTLQEPGDR